jgi:hypothetical protein
MKRVMAIAVLLFSAGCHGPLTFPAVERLSPDEQAQIDRGWNNMLSPIDRLDRGLLLDVVIFYLLHQVGVDRLRLHSEKDYAGGTIVMTIDYARANDPATDRLTLEVKDRAGKSIRKETYSGAEVLGQVKSFGNATTRPDGKPTEDQVTRQAWFEARLRQIVSATQPADSEATTMPSAK